MKERNIKTQPIKQNGVNTWKGKRGVEKQRRLWVKAIRDLGNEDLRRPKTVARKEKGKEKTKAEKVEHCNECEIFKVINASLKGLCFEFCCMGKRNGWMNLDVKHGFGWIDCN